MILLLTDYDKRFSLPLNLFLLFIAKEKKKRKKEKRKTTIIKYKFRNKTFPILFRIQIIIKNMIEAKNWSLLRVLVLLFIGKRQTTQATAKERKSNGNCFESHFFDDTRSRRNKIKHIIVGKVRLCEVGKVVAYHGNWKIK